MTRISIPSFQCLRKKLALNITLDSNANVNSWLLEEASAMIAMRIDDSNEKQ